MAKRFTDTEIWEEDWFIELTPDYQFFWIYLKDNCDYVGIWRPNIAKFKKLFGRDINLSDALCILNKEKVRIELIDGGRWFLTQFIPFQYGRVLNLSNRFHKSIYDSLVSNNVDLTSIRPQIVVKLESGQGVDTPKVKDKVIKDVCNKDKINPIFESLWEKYPKRLGKKESLKHFLESVKTEEDVNNIKKALDNYIRYCIDKDPQFIKLGSTWFNNWQDWVNYNGDNNGKQIGTTKRPSQVFG